MKAFVIGLVIIIGAAIPDARGAEPASVGDIQFVTEYYPPYNYEVKGRPTGIWVDILKTVLENMQVRQDKGAIQVMPWARAYRAALNKPNTCVFGTLRTKEREDLFKWAGPVTRGGNVLIALKSNNIEVRHPEDIARYKTGVVKDDYAEIQLKNYGVPEHRIALFYGKDASQEIILALDSGMVDLWCIHHISARWLLKRYGFDPGRFRTVYELENPDGYFAFNRQTPDHVVAAFQMELDRVLASPLFQELLTRYLSEPILP